MRGGSTASYGICSLILIGTLLAIPGPALAGPRIEVDEARIYLGNVRDFVRPATVDEDAVFAKIPEYREIVDRGMDESNPRYLFLMRAASDRFRTAIEAVAKSGGHDLIGGKGAIRGGSRKIPDITKQVIAALPR